MSIVIVVGIWLFVGMGFLSGCSHSPLMEPLASQEATPSGFTLAAGEDWDILNQEVTELYRAGKYDQAVVVAKKALEVAEENVGPNHPDVATSLENLAALYRATKRDEDAETLEQRAARIRAIQR